MISRDLRKQLNQFRLPYLSGWPAIQVCFGFHLVILCAVFLNGTFHNILWVTIQFCLGWFPAVCTQNLLRGNLLKALVTKERSEQILLITEFTGRGLLPEDASSLSVVHWRISCLVRWRSNIGDWILRSEPFVSRILSALMVSVEVLSAFSFLTVVSFFFKERFF